MLPILIHLLLAIHIIVSLLIILVVLMQRPKSEGLGAAFGGGVTDQFWGAQTSNVLAKFTRWLGGIFFALTLTLSILYSRQSTALSPATSHLLQAPAPIRMQHPAKTGTSGTNALISGTEAEADAVSGMGPAPVPAADGKLLSKPTGTTQTAPGDVPAPAGTAPGPVASPASTNAPATPVH